ncbi:hypothetical protein Agub_g4198 [Astrephomene gubernaculifera]|uniref:Uncharacterized protein n=1 Tax=Astrephomene gubernaculifera TaxID=47775 RepID=A0AAD3DKB9_9CHLO|nr:hypothetical protein Agub_g4198 [Astrephomene gubernaculifera]
MATRHSCLSLGGLNKEGKCGYGCNKHTLTPSEESLQEFLTSEGFDKSLVSAIVRDKIFPNRNATDYTKIAEANVGGKKLRVRVNCQHAVAQAAHLTEAGKFEESDIFFEQFTEDVAHVRSHVTRSTPAGADPLVIGQALLGAARKALRSVLQAVDISTFLSLRFRHGSSRRWQHDGVDSGTASGGRASSNTSSSTSSTGCRAYHEQSRSNEALSLLEKFWRIDERSGLYSPHQLALCVAVEAAIPPDKLLATMQEARQLPFMQDMINDSGRTSAGWREHILGTWSPDGMPSARLTGAGLDTYARLVSVALGKVKPGFTELHVFEPSTGLLWTYPSFVGPFTVDLPLSCGAKPVRLHVNGCHMPGFRMDLAVDPLPRWLVTRDSLLLRSVEWRLLRLALASTAEQASNAVDVVLRPASLAPGASPNPRPRNPAFNAIESTSLGGLQQATVDAGSIELTPQQHKRRARSLRDQDDSDYEDETAVTPPDSSPPVKHASKRRCNQYGGPAARPPPARKQGGKAASQRKAEVEQFMRITPTRPLVPPPRPVVCSDVLLELFPFTEGPDGWEYRPPRLMCKCRETWKPRQRLCRSRASQALQPLLFALTNDNETQSMTGSEL